MNYLKEVVFSFNEEYTLFSNSFFNLFKNVIRQENGKIYLMGRNWKKNYAPLFPEIIKEIKQIKANNFVLDSELTFFKNLIFQNFYLLSKARLTNNKPKIIAKFSTQNCTLV